MRYFAIIATLFVMCGCADLPKLGGTYSITVGISPTASTQDSPASSEVKNEKPDSSSEESAARPAETSP